MTEKNPPLSLNLIEKKKWLYYIENEPALCRIGFVVLRHGMSLLCWHFSLSLLWGRYENV